MEKRFTFFALLALGVSLIAGCPQQEDAAAQPEMTAVRPDWAKNYTQECFLAEKSAHEMLAICKDIETGCQYMTMVLVERGSFGSIDVELTTTPRLNTQGKPMCGGTQ